MMAKIKDVFNMAISRHEFDIEHMRHEQEEHIKRQQEEMRRRDEYERQWRGMYSNQYDPNPWAAQPKERALHEALADTNQLVKKLVARQEQTNRDLERLSAFYYWVIDVHPELTAQYKAMRDLYEAANPTGTVPGEQTEGPML